jgi:DNA-binding response OmpR family regulator
MPKMNGLELLSKIREKDQNIKCIILTAHTDKKFLLQATQLKLTDYLLKPLKRSELKNALLNVIDEIETYEVIHKKVLFLNDGFTWDIKSSQLLLNKTEVILTNTEIKLLELFFQNKNINLSYDKIIINIWDTFEKAKINALKTAIKKLRKKLPKDTIINIYGFGYKVL